ncbi:MAG: hypothetical protein L0191_20950 [Acidobacteria bacterium]|nr:hypothetical protein [Acidobacteriota bacterium]
MGSKVFVGNLPFSVDEQQLRTLLRRPGQFLAPECAADLSGVPFCTTSTQPSPDNVT